MTAIDVRHHTHPDNPNFGPNDQPFESEPSPADETFDFTGTFPELDDNFDGLFTVNDREIHLTTGGNSHRVSNSGPRAP